MSRHGFITKAFVAQWENKCEACHCKGSSFNAISTSNYHHITAWTKTIFYNTHIHWCVHVGLEMFNTAFWVYEKPVAKKDLETLHESSVCVSLGKSQVLSTSARKALTFILTHALLVFDKISSLYTCRHIEYQAQTFLSWILNYPSKPSTCSSSSIWRV